MASDNLSILDYEWHCPSCTFINKAGSFKCFMCGTPKGTSTRQVKFSFSGIEQQYVAESMSRFHGSKSGYRTYGGERSFSKRKMKTKVALDNHSNNTAEGLSQEKDVDYSGTVGENIKEVHATAVTSVEVGKPYFSHSEDKGKWRFSGEKIAKKELKVVKGASNVPSTTVRSKRKTMSVWPKLENIDRSSSRRQAVTVNSVTVYITEYNFLHSDSD